MTLYTDICSSDFQDADEIRFSQKNLSEEEEEEEKEVKKEKGGKGGKGGEEEGEGGGGGEKGVTVPSSITRISSSFGIFL